MLDSVSSNIIKLHEGPTARSGCAPQSRESRLISHKSSWVNVEKLDKIGEIWQFLDHFCRFQIGSRWSPAQHALGPLGPLGLGSPNICGAQAPFVGAAFGNDITHTWHII
jgi:hypothetical protein